MSTYLKTLTTEQIYVQLESNIGMMTENECNCQVRSTVQHKVLVSTLFFHYSELTNMMSQ